MKKYHEKRYNFMMIVNIRCTGGVADTAKRAWNWDQGTCWTVVADGARAILGEVVRPLRCWLHGSTLAEKTLQTRTWTKIQRHHQFGYLLLNGLTSVRVCTFW